MDCDRAGPVRVVPCAPFGCGWEPGSAARLADRRGGGARSPSCTAIVLTVAAGARRTASSPDRYTPSVGGDLDASITQREGHPLTDQVAALPGGGGRQRATRSCSAGSTTTGTTFPTASLRFAGERPLSTRVIAGRDLDQRDPHEFLADRSFTKATGAHVGDQFAFRSISRKTIERGEGFSGKPDGTSFPATLVGVLDSPDEIKANSPWPCFPTLAPGGGRRLRRNGHAGAAGARVTRPGAPARARHAPEPLDGSRSKRDP